MDEHIKTVGYLLKHYTDSQCYDQYVELRWLKSEIQKQREKHKKCTPDDCGACYVCDRFLALLEG